MYFALFLDLNDLNYIGYIPQFPNDMKGRVVMYKLENGWDDVDLINDDIDGTGGINDTCDSLLAYGDVDYLDSGKCAKLKSWIEKRIDKPIESRYKEMLNVLHDYCNRAVELNTGVVIDI